MIIEKTKFRDVITDSESSQICDLILYINFKKQISLKTVEFPERT